MKISINWDILEIIHALWRGLGAGTDNCTVSKVCESSKPKYRRTAFVLPTNSRICAVLDRENPVLRTVLNSWLKAGVHSIFSECRHRSLGSLRMFCSYFASLPPCSPVPIPSCPQLALLLWALLTDTRAGSACLNTTQLETKNVGKGDNRGQGCWITRTNANICLINEFHKGINSCQENTEIILLGYKIW